MESQLCVPLDMSQTGNGDGGMPADGLGDLVMGSGPLFIRESCGTAANLNAIFGIDANNVWAAGDNSTACYFDGTRWSKVNLTGNPSANFTGIWGASATDVWLVGSGGVRLRGGPTTWQADPTPYSSTNAIHGIWGSSATDIYLVEESNNIRHYNGVWSFKTTNAGSSFAGIWGTDFANIWAVGDNGTIVRWNEVTTTWDTQTSGTTRNFASLYGYDSSHVWAVGGSLNQVIDVYNGTKWTIEDPQIANFPNFFHGVWVGVGSDISIWVVGEGGAIIHYESGAWFPKPSGVNNNLNAVFSTDPNHLWIVGDGGVILRLNLPR